MESVGQQINLYQPVFRPRRVLLPGALIFPLVLVLAAGLMGVYGIERRTVAALEKQVALARTQRDATASQLERLQMRFPERPQSKLLQKRLVRTEADVNRYRMLLDRLAAETSGTAGFSAHLRGLAAQRVDGLWLTGFRISEGGSAFQLTGAALRAELVPAWVQGLAENRVFSGLQFARLEIRRPADNPERVDFRIQTSEAAEP